MITKKKVYVVLMHTGINRSMTQLVGVYDTMDHANKAKKEYTKDALPYGYVWVVESELTEKQ